MNGLCGPQIVADHGQTFFLIHLCGQPQNLLYDAFKAICEGLGAETGNLGTGVLEKLDSTCRVNATRDFAAGELGLTGVHLHVVLELQHLLRGVPVERLGLHPPDGFLVDDIAFHQVLGEVSQRRRIDAGVLADQHSQLGGCRDIDVHVVGVAVDVPHHVGEFMHLALTHHAALDLAVDIEHERIHAVRVDIPVDIQQSTACEEGNVDRVPLLLRVVAPVPVLQQERLALGFIGIQPLKRGLQSHGVVFLRVIRNEHRLLRIVFCVPGKRMPRQFDDGSGILNRCGGRIPDDALNREPGNADVSLSKVHLLIPHDLRDRRAGNQEVLRSAAVELPDVVHLHDILDHVVHVGCEARQIFALRNQHGLRRVIHLVCNAVVER